MASPGDESHTLPITLHTEQDRPVLVFPIPDPSPVCVRWSRIPVYICPKHPNGSRFCRRFLEVKADDKANKGDEPKPADAGLPLPLPNSQLEADYATDVMCPATLPKVLQSWARTPTLPDDESTSELEPADAKPRLQPQSPSGATSGHGVDPQQRSGSRDLSQHRDHRDDNDRTSSPEHPDLFTPNDRGESAACSLTLPDDESTGELESADTEPHFPPQSPSGAASSRGIDLQQRSGSCCLSQHGGHHGDSVQTSNLEYRHPLVPDVGGEQGVEISVVPPQVQESRAGMLILSSDETGNEYELANTEPSAGQERVNLRHNIGRRRRRRDTNDEECSPIVGSDDKQGKDEDAVQPPRGKRRRVNTSAPTTRTAPKRQAHLRYTNLSLQAQQSPPTQGPKRRQSQRISKPQSSGASALEEETLGAAFASFEEWPLEAVLKRVLVGGAAKFQVEFTWNPCTNHGRNDHTPETQRRKSRAGRASSTGRALPSRVASTTEKVQGGEYFKVEDIREWRQGKEGREYLVKWAGYGNKHNTWEPAAHFAKCFDILEQFHQRKGLPTTS